MRTGQLNPAAYPVFALAAVPLLIGGILVSALATHHKIPTLRVPTKEKFSVTRVVSEVRLAFKNSLLHGRRLCQCHLWYFTGYDPGAYSLYGDLFLCPNPQHAFASFYLRDRRNDLW